VLSGKPAHGPVSVHRAGWWEGDSANAAEIDGQAFTPDGSQGILVVGNGELLTIPFTAAGFSKPVGKLDDVAIPENDQILLH
jgi:hypothetical protein